MIFTGHFQMYYLEAFSITLKLLFVYVDFDVFYIQHKLLCGIILSVQINIDMRNISMYSLVKIIPQLLSLLALIVCLWSKSTPLEVKCVTWPLNHKLEKIFKSPDFNLIRILKLIVS